MQKFNFLLIALAILISGCDENVKVPVTLSKTISLGRVVTSEVSMKENFNPFMDGFMRDMSRQIDTTTILHCENGDVTLYQNLSIPSEKQLELLVYSDGSKRLRIAGNERTFSVGR